MLKAPFQELFFIHLKLKKIENEITKNRLPIIVLFE